MEEQDRRLIADLDQNLDSGQYDRIIFLPVAIRAGQTGESFSPGSQTPTPGRTSRPVWSLPTCLTSCTLNRFTSIPVLLREEIEGFDEPTLVRMLAELDHRMMPFQTHAGARVEFKNLMQGKKEALMEFSRRVRSLGNVVNANIGVQASDDMNREQFIDVLFDVELQDQLLREDLGSLGQAVARAQALALVRRLHGPGIELGCIFAGVAWDAPEQGAEATRGVGRQSSPLSQLGSSAGGH